MFLAEALRASCPQGTAPPVLSLGIPRAYIAQDKPDRILARMGLDATGIAGSVREAVGASSRQAAGARRGRTTAPAVPPRPATLTAQDAPD
jgi:hypothetical protein